jgi:hypothetical protein
MFKLIAMLFVVTNGVPAETPTGSVQYNNSLFPTMEACMSFLGSDEGKSATEYLQEISRKKQMLAGFACVPAEKQG